MHRAHPESMMSISVPQYGNGAGGGASSEVAHEVGVARRREDPVDQRFEGKVALITGAARGQGRAEALRLARRGRRRDRDRRVQRAPHRQLRGDGPRRPRRDRPARRRTSGGAIVSRRGRHPRHRRPPGRRRRGGRRARAPRRRGRQRRHLLLRPLVGAHRGAVPHDDRRERRRHLAHVQSDDPDAHRPGRGRGHHRHELGRRHRAACPGSATTWPPSTRSRGWRRRSRTSWAQHNIRVMILVPNAVNTPMGVDQTLVASVQANPALGSIFMNALPSTLDRARRGRRGGRVHRLGRRAAHDGLGGRDRPRDARPLGGLPLGARRRAPRPPSFS